jgi:hypothetical protein
MTQQQEKPQRVSMQNAGHANGQPYMRFELPKISRVGETFAITLYQIDYNNFAESKPSDDNLRALDAAKNEIIPVAKVCTSLDGLRNLRSAIDEILKLTGVSEQGAKND